jgi:hypothetical protein
MKLEFTAGLSEADLATTADELFRSLLIHIKGGRAHGS